MPFSRFQKFFDLFKRTGGGPRPIVSLRHDLAVVRRVRGQRAPRLRQLFHIHRILSAKEKYVLGFSVAVLCASSAWLLFSIFNTFRVQIPAVGGSYTEGIVGSPRLINPLFAGLNDVDMDLTRLIYSGLMRYDASGRLATDLASKYTVSEDKKTYTFELKQDVRWHDGESLDAKDVVFTFESMQDQQIGSPSRISFQNVTVTAVDDHTVSFALPEPFQSFLSSLTIGILPEHVWSQISPDQIRLAQRNLKPIGTGPYKFTKLLKDEAGFITAVELERFADYYRSPAYIRELRFQFFHEYETLNGVIEALREQKVHGLQFIPFDLRSKVMRKNITLHTLQLPQYSALFFNKDKAALLQDRDVRRALLQGIDKDRILKETIASEGAVMNGPLLPGNPGYDAGFSPYVYSVAEANDALDKKFERIDADDYREELKQLLLEQKRAEFSSTTPEGETAEQDEAQLLQEVGQELDVRLNEAQLFYRKIKDGDIVRLNIVTADTVEYQKAAQLVAGSWQELGVQTTVTFVPAKDIARVVLKDRSYDVLLYGVIVGNDPDQFPFWHSTQIDYPGLNLSRYVNRTVDEIIEKTRGLDDREQLNTLYTQFQETVVNDIPAIFLYTPTYTYVLNSDIKGFDMIQISHPSDRFADITKWYIKTKHEFKK